MLNIGRFAANIFFNSSALDEVDLYWESGFIAGKWICSEKNVVEKWICNRKMYLYARPPCGQYLFNNSAFDKVDLSGKVEL